MTSSVINPPPLTISYRDLPTGVLLDQLLDDIRRTLHGGRGGIADNRTARVRAACVVLQARHGRDTGTGMRDVSNPVEALAEDIDRAGGFLLVRSDQVRQAIGSLYAAHVREGNRAVASGQEPVAHHIRTHAETLQDHGIAVFPILASGLVEVLAYDQTLLLGQLLTALAAGEDVETLTAEILAAAA